MKKAFIFAAILFSTRVARADCVGCAELVWIVPLTVLVVDLGSSTATWGIGKLVGKDGSFSRTYWVGLGISVIGGVAVGKITNDLQYTEIGLALGLLGGNVIGFTSSMENSKRIRIRNVEEDSYNRIQSSLLQVKF